MTSKCKIISYTFCDNFNEDTFKGLNVLPEINGDCKDYKFLEKLTVDKGYVISKNKIYFMIHSNYTVIDPIDGIINVKLIDFPKDADNQSDEYINYFHDIKDFVFEELKLNKKDKPIIIIRDVDTDQIFITNGNYNQLLYEKEYSEFFKKDLYNQFYITFRR